MKKPLKILGGVLSAALLLAAVLIANGLFGNPVSGMLARKTANEYLRTAYPDTDYYVEGVAYNFKDGNYYAHIRSDSSIDTQFTLYITMTGKLRLDTYDSVADGFVTAQRLDSEYRALTDTILNSAEYPYNAYDSFAFGTLEIYPVEAFADMVGNDVPFYAMDQSTLVIDHVYDIRELGRQSGHLVVYVDSDTVTVEHAAEIMLNIKALFDAEAIPFAAMDLVLQHPRGEDGVQAAGEVAVRHFPYEEIYADGLRDRLIQADAELKAYYAEMDAKYK